MFSIFGMAIPPPPRYGAAVEVRQEEEEGPPTPPLAAPPSTRWQTEERAHDERNAGDGGLAAAAAARGEAGPNETGQSLGWAEERKCEGQRVACIGRWREGEGGTVKVQVQQSGKKETYLLSPSV